MSFARCERRSWTEERVEHLVEMRRLRVPWFVIADQLATTEMAVKRKFYRVLMKRRAEWRARGVAHANEMRMAREREAMLAARQPPPKPPRMIVQQAPAATPEASLRKLMRVDGRQSPA